MTRSTQNIDTKKFHEKIDWDEIKDLQKFYILFISLPPEKKIQKLENISKFKQYYSKNLKLFKFIKIINEINHH